MSRTYKFRAWDKHEGVMRDCEWLEKNDFALGVNGKMVKWLPDCLCLRDHNMFPMQSTGLHDKNGKEIYEGDIVEWRLDEGQEYIITNDDPSPLRKIISWNKEEGRFELRNTANEGNQSGYILCKRNCEKMAEVIGNIYSNPDLLSPDRKTV